MHNPFEPELLSGRLELNEVFHYPTSKTIGSGMLNVDLRPDDLRALIAANEVTPVAVHALILDKLRRARGLVEVTGGRVSIGAHIAIASENIDEARAEEARRRAGCTPPRKDLLRGSRNCQRRSSSLAQLRVKRRHTR